MDAKMIELLLEMKEDITEIRKDVAELRSQDLETAAYIKQEVTPLIDIHKKVVWLVNRALAMITVAGAVVGSIAAILKFGGK